jgi:hypothetical protein
VPNTQTTYSVNDSNIEAIVDAVFSLARDCGVGWKGETEFDLPEEGQVTGIPWLAVPMPEFVGYGAGQVLMGEWLERADMEIQMFWDLSVYCIAPYNAGDSTTKRTLLQAGRKLQTVFHGAVNLTGTCDTASPGKPEWVRISKRDPNANPGATASGPVLWQAAMLQIRCMETVAVSYYAP